MNAIATAVKQWISPNLMREDMRLMRRYLRDRNPVLRAIETGLFWAAAFASLIPFWVYIVDTWQSVALMAGILGLIFLAQLVHTVRILTLASYSGSRELESGTWDSLVLTGLTAQQIVISKWLVVVRMTLDGTIALSLMRVGAVVGLAIFMHHVVYESCNRYLATPLCYYSVTRATYFFTGTYRNFPEVMNDVSVRSLTGIIMLCIVYGVSSAILNAAICMFSTLWTGKRTAGLIGAIGTLAIVILINAVIWVSISSATVQSEAWVNQQATAYSRSNSWSYPVVISALPFEKLVRDFAWAYKSIVLVFTPLVDGGITTVTNAFREVPQPRSQVIQSLITMGAGIAVLIGLTRVCLNAAIHAAERHAALGVRDEEK